MIKDVIIPEPDREQFLLSRRFASDTALTFFGTYMLVRQHRFQVDHRRYDSVAKPRSTQHGTGFD